MDTDGSQQAALHARVVDLLTAPLTSKMMIVGEMTDVGKQRHPHSADFNNLWDDLVANAHHRIECVPCPDNISCVCVCVCFSCSCYWFCTTSHQQVSRGWTFNDTGT